MTAIVHARLDEETRRLLARLKRRRGWTDSQAVREGIRALAERALVDEPPTRAISGLGRFASGIPDLGSDRRHLDGFGRR